MKSILFLLILLSFFINTNSLLCNPGYKYIRDRTLEGNLVSGHCQICPIGSASYNINGNSENCYVCENNLYSSAEGSLECLECNGSNYIATTDYSTSGSFIECPLGSYKPSKDSKTCISCPKHTSTGINTVDSESKNCQPCLPGYVTNSNGECLPCRLGTYFINTGGRLSCKVCPPGSYCDKSPALKFEICPEGWGSLAGSTSIKDCNLNLSVDSDVLEMKQSALNNNIEHVAKYTIYQTCVGHFWGKPSYKKCIAILKQGEEKKLND